MGAAASNLAPGALHQQDLAQRWVPFPSKAWHPMRKRTPCCDVRDKRTPNSLRVAKPSLRNIFLHTYRRNTVRSEGGAESSSTFSAAIYPNYTKMQGAPPTDASSAQIV